MGEFVKKFFQYLSHSKRTQQKTFSKLWKFLVHFPLLKYFYFFNLWANLSKNFFNTFPTLIALNKKIFFPSFYLLADKYNFFIAWPVRPGYYPNLNLKQDPRYLQHRLFCLRINFKSQFWFLRSDATCSKVFSKNFSGR